MKLALALASLLFAQTTFAAITSDFDCKTADGARVYFESQVGLFDDQGNITGEMLYRNRVSISVKGLDVEFVPDKVLVNGSAALLAAWKNDGQYVIVNANYKSKDEGDSATYEGQLEFRVKSKAGVLQRKEGPKAVCTMTGEA